MNQAVRQTLHAICAPNDVGARMSAKVYRTLYLVVGSLQSAMLEAGSKSGYRWCRYPMAGVECFYPAQRVECQVSDRVVVLRCIEDQIA
jgi:hypothetical protein